MTRIWHRLPFHGDPITVRGIELKVRMDQILGWASISVPDETVWSQRIPKIPIVLDTGHSYRLLITATQLRNWAGIDKNALPAVGSVKLHTPGKEVTEVTRAARVWLHPNRPGCRDQCSSSEPFSLEVEEGIVVCADNASYAPRMPALGLKALVENALCVSVNGRKRLSWLHTSWWLIDPRGRT